MEKSLIRGDWKIKLENEAKLRGFSPRTILNYLHRIERYLRSEKTPREYLLFMIDNNKADETIRNTGFAIKLYLQVMGLKDDFAIPNLKREKKLPVILSRIEIDKT